MHQLHERLSAQAEHFENTGPEDDNLQKATDRSVFAGLLRRAADIVRVHETGVRIADIFDPIIGTFTPREVKGCGVAPRERSPGGNVTISPDDLQRLHSYIAELEQQVVHERQGARFSLNAVAVQDDAWAVADDLDKLMVQEGISQEMRETAGSTAHFMELAIRALRAAAELIEANGLARAPTSTMTSADMSDALTLQARNLLTAIRLHEAAERDIPRNDPELVQTLAVMRTAALRLKELTASEREELEDLRVRYGVAEAQLGVLGDELDQIAELVRPGVRDTKIVDGKDHSWKAPSTIELVREYVARRGKPGPKGSQLGRELAAGAAELARVLNLPEGAGLHAEPVEAALRRAIDLMVFAIDPANGALLGSMRYEFAGVGGVGSVTIITNEAGEIAQVVCHDVGPEPEDEDDEESLAARCKVTSNNLSTLLGPIGGEAPVPEPLRSGIVTASVLLGDVADTLRVRDRKWWVIEDMSDGRDERATLYVLPHDDGPIDKAVARWAASLEYLVASDEQRDPRDDMFDTAINTMAFRPEHTVAWLEQHPGEFFFVQPAGAEKLLAAIDALEDGESLYLEDGSIVTTYADSDERQPRDVFRLLDFCDSDDAGIGDSFHPDDMALGEDDEPDPDLVAQRDEENLRDHDDFARRTDPPNPTIELGNGAAFISAPMSSIQKVVTPEGIARHYVQQGWSLHLTSQRVHLVDDMSAIACDPGALIKGVRIEPEQLGEVGRELCGSCCAVANDRAAANP